MGRGDVPVLVVEAGSPGAVRDRLEKYATRLGKAMPRHFGRSFEVNVRARAGVT
jgi:hypothetical protein